MQVANSCPQLSNGLPGLRTSIRIRSVCAQDVARWPRIHGSLHCGQIPRKWTCSLYTSILPRKLKISTKNICSRWWSACWMCRRLPINARRHPVVQSDCRSCFSKTPKRFNIESQMEDSRTLKEFQNDREKSAMILMYCSAFKAWRKRTIST